jgi:hypothetical protein
MIPPSEGNVGAALTRIGLGDLFSGVASPKLEPRDDLLSHAPHLATAPSATALNAVSHR